MNVKQTSRKSIFLGLLAVIALLVLICLGTLAVLAITSNNSQKLAQVIDDNTITLSSDLGHFAIDLPSTYAMKQSAETKQIPEDPSKADYLAGSIVFRTILDSPIQANMITVTYGKPEILGKGGSCIGNDGELATPGYVSTVIAGEVMVVCQNNFEMTAAYIKHPTQEIEYVIAIQADDQQSFGVLAKAVADIKFRESNSP